MLLHLLYLCPRVIMKIGRYTGVIIMMVVFLAASGLQYTHDITHDQDCFSTDLHEHEHPDSDECALCWFVLHQTVSSFVFDSLLPEVATQEHVNSLNALYRLSREDGIERSLGNKDPPLSI